MGGGQHSREFNFSRLCCKSLNSLDIPIIKLLRKKRKNIISEIEFAH